MILKVKNDKDEWIDIPAITGVGIESIQQINQSTEGSGVNLIRCKLTDGREEEFVVRNGKDGIDGIGIASIKTESSVQNGGMNWVTVTLTDGSSKTFGVQNGSKGDTGRNGAKGDKGDKGDAFTYDDMTDEQKADFFENAAEKNHGHDVAKYSETYSDEDLFAWTNIARGESVVSVSDGVIKIPVDGSTRVVFSPEYAKLANITHKITVTANRCVLQYGYLDKTGYINEDGNVDGSITFNIDIPETGLLLQLGVYDAWGDSYIEIRMRHDAVCNDGFMSSSDKKLLMELAKQCEQIGDIDTALSNIINMMDELAPMAYLPGENPEPIEPIE